MLSARVARDTPQLMHWHRPGRRRKKLKGHTTACFISVLIFNIPSLSTGYGFANRFPVIKAEARQGHYFCPSRSMTSAASSIAHCPAV